MFTFDKKLFNCVSTNALRPVLEYLLTNRSGNAVFGIRLSQNMKVNMEYEVIVVLFH